MGIFRRRRRPEVPGPGFWHSSGHGDLADLVKDHSLPDSAEDAVEADDPEGRHGDRATPAGSAGPEAASADRPRSAAG